MSEKDNLKNREMPPLTMHQRKLEKPYAPGNQKTTAKINQQESGPRRARGKKQRRQFKLEPNRG